MSLKEDQKYVENIYNKKSIKAKEIEIHKYKIEENFKTRNKNFIKGRNNKFKDSNSEIVQSKEELIKMKNKLTLKDEVEIKTIDFNEKEYEQKPKIKNDIKKEEKKGIFRRSLNWFNYIINEIPLFWKKEELIESYDANGNVIMRPKKKIPYKNKQKNVDKEYIKDQNEANFKGIDCLTKGTNYGVYFN